MGDAASHQGFDQHAAPQSVGVTKIQRRHEAAKLRRFPATSIRESQARADETSTARSEEAPQVSRAMPLFAGGENVVLRLAKLHRYNTPTRRDRASLGACEGSLVCLIRSVGKSAAVGRFTSGHSGQNREIDRIK